MDGRVKTIRADRQISLVAPIKAETLACLARGCGIDPVGLAETLHRYNAACTGEPDRFFDATRTTPKSDSAGAGKTPFLAFPVVGAIAYTFARLATNADAGASERAGP
jgi:tricarballylate dehydrogenase